MSRLIVKNLPNKVTIEGLKEIFGQKGEVTDVQLKYTKDGKFRNFGFVGYRSEAQAAAAREYFDGTCVRSMKIQAYMHRCGWVNSPACDCGAPMQNIDHIIRECPIRKYPGDPADLFTLRNDATDWVEVCANLGDEQKPRAWSKYAPDSTAYRQLHKDEIDQDRKLEFKKKKKAQKRKDKIIELLKKHKDDPLFAEFIEAHVNDKTTWIKEALEEAAKSGDDSGVEDEGDGIDKETVKGSKEDESIKETVDTTKTEEKVANKPISDLEYMKLLMRKVDNSAEKKEEEEKEDKPKKVRNRQLFHVKVTGLPFKCKKKDIKEFFRPLVPYSIRFPLGKGKKISGFCYVGFRTEKELKKAIIKDKLFIGNHRLHVHKYEDKSKQAAEEEEQATQRKNCEKGNNEESIGESGSIFVRNLPYVVSEEELTSLFDKFGPLAEVNMPIDPVLRQPKGFATVTFMMPEHAVRAYTALDGTAFCGRMLHLLPARAESVEDGASDDDGLSFKEKKAKKLKAQAKSSHNWNVLFLGANAVADVVASNYNTTKEQLLNDNNKKTSAAVRLALGETQLVTETRNFLESNGVYLDAFNKPAKRRSKTCIIVKNLPANTEKDEVKALFIKHGHIARFLMPLHGITALVDFVEPFEAKKAFTKLAYSQFKSSPLYLEWAPENVFIKSTQNKESVDEASTEKSVSVSISVSDKEQILNSNTKKTSLQPVNEHGDKKEDIAEETPEPDSDTTLFIKNLNFITTEDTLKAHFASCGKIHNVTIAKKKDPKNPGQFLSMGYGFIQFYKKDHTNEALKSLQSSTLDGKTLELKRWERGNSVDIKTSKKSNKDTAQNGTKILVRNVPFQANRNELHEIFRAFGEIKTLRLPKKLSPGSEQHRGFAFVDYHSKADAKSAFDALCQSTHLYGRRLVLEWADQADENEDIGSLRKRTAQAFNATVPGGKKSRKGAVDTDVFVEGDR